MNAIKLLTVVFALIYITTVSAFSYALSLSATVLHEASGTSTPSMLVGAFGVLLTLALYKKSNSDFSAEHHESNTQSF